MPFKRYLLLFLPLVLILLLGGISGCDRDRKQEKPPATLEQYKEPMVNVNKKMVRTEDELIQDFTERYGWKMIKTGSGLRYLIYSGGNGRIAGDGNKATIRYSVTLLSGDTCYTDMTRSFVLGKDKVEPGIDEGIRFLRVGDKAKFILPSHLAFGLMGDYGKIPRKATLVYDLELIEVN